MKWFLILWAAPVVCLTGWYGLSYYDMNFGFFMLTRQTHDLVFNIYGQILGIDPEKLPPMVARAIAFDSLVVFAIIAFRKRKAISAWWNKRYAEPAAEPRMRASDASLSSAP